jgi:hypothetical protein
MEATFRAGDETLAQLVAARREEVAQLQAAQADRLSELETRGQARMAALNKSLPREIVSTLDNLDRTHEEATVATRSNVEEVRARLVESSPSPQNETAAHPGLAGGHLIAPNSLGWFTPYWDSVNGYNTGNIDVSAACSGSGSGIFGTGANSQTVEVDWWFTYAAPQDRNYGHTIWVPFHGFYIIYADDGFWDSKEAHARIDLSAVGYQYNYKATGTTNVFDMDSQNINVDDRIDGWHTMYYADLLGADTAYLRVSATLYVYARGGGSHSELNFSDGNANYLGVPWVYID